MKKYRRAFRFMLALVLVLASLLSLAAASAEGVLTVDLRGLNLVSGRNWRSVALHGLFDVADAQGNYLGTVAANPTQAQISQGVAASLTVPEGFVVLTPRQDSMPQGYAFESSYMAQTGTGKNTVTLLAYKAEGLFGMDHVYADGERALGGQFRLVDAQGQEQLVFATDANGAYEAQEPLPAGSYTLYEAVLAPGALPTQGTPIQIPVYNGQEIPHVTVTSSRVPALQEKLGNPVLTCGDAPKSLYENEQTYTVALTDALKGENTWPLTGYTVHFGGLTLVDDQGAAIQDQTALYFSQLAYQAGTSGYQLSVQLLDSQGKAVGSPALLSDGASFVNTQAQACQMVVTYVNAQGQAVVETGFDAGVLTASVTSSQRQPQINAPRAAGIRVAAQGKYQVVYADLEGQIAMEGQTTLAEVILPVDESFHVSAYVTVNGEGQGEAVIRNTGSRTFANGDLTLALPEGWQIAQAGQGAQAVRMTSGDYLVLDEVETLKPGEEMHLSLTLSAFDSQGEGILYIKNLLGTEPVKDDPQGRLFPQATLILDPSRNLEGFAAFGFTAQAQGSQAAVAADSLRGTLYEDKNGNGVKDADEKGEAGLCVEKVQQGVTLRAYTQADGSFELPGTLGEGEALSFILPEHMMAGEANERMEIPYTVTCMLHGSVTVGGAPLEGVRVSAAGRTVLTDEAGAYRFSQMTAGSYEVTFELTGGLENVYAFGDGSRGLYTAAPVTLNEENKEAQVSAQAVALGSVMLEASGLDGAEATLTQNGNLIAASVFADGKVVMRQVYPGDYQMTIQLPQGKMLTDLNGYTFVQKGTAQWNLGVTQGQNSLYRLGLADLGRLEGKVNWQGTENLTVTIQGTQEAWSLETTGLVAFSDLIPDTYLISVPVPQGYVLAADSWTSQNGIASLTVQVEAGKTAQMAELVLSRVGRVAGQVFEDLNANGVKDDSESAKSRIAVSLYKLNGNDPELYLETATDDQGNYTFSDLAPGMYCLTMKAPSGAAFNQVGGSAIPQSGQSAPFEVGDGQQLQMNGTLVVPTGLRAVVFWDSNESGDRGIYERSVEGVTVSVVDMNGSVVAAGKTNYDGEVRFKDLLSGTYQVRFDLPRGYAFSAKGNGNINDTTSAAYAQEGSQALTDPITLTPGHETAVGAGVVRLGFVSGRVWYDTDAGGVMTENEPGQAGITVQLVPRRGNGKTYEVITNENGEYLFDGVRTGSYDLTLTAPEGMMFTRYSKTGRDMRSIFTGEGMRTGEKTLVVESGKTIDNQNIGLVTGGIIEGIVFLDADYDGLWQPGDETLAGVELELEKISTGDKLGGITVGDDGAFKFEALRGGNYRIKATLPNESVVFTSTVTMDQSGNWFENQPGRLDSTLQKLALEDMEHKTIYVGAVRTGSISGTLYMDDNYSASKDQTEAACANLIVTLVNENGSVVARDTSDASGSYRFEGLVPGAYQVLMEAKEGYVFTKLGEDNLVTSLSDEGDGATALLTLSMGQTLTGVDGGLILPGRVSGSFFNDANDNGVQDNGEGGLSGVTVTLVNRQDDSMAFQLVTAEDGAYSFNRVMPGAYYVRYDLPEDGAFAPTEAKGNTLTGIGLTASSEAFEFKMAEKKQMPLAGGLILARIEGRVYEDLNGSGQYEEGERFLDGVRLSFNGQEQVTGPDGAFLVKDIHPGEYAMTFGNLENYVFTRDGVTIAPRGQRAYEGVYAAAAGQKDTGLMIGMTPKAQVTGFVWMDEDVSGSWNEMDTMITGLNVTLRDLTDGESLFNVVTDADGRFHFDGVVPGRYDIAITLPDGCIAAQAGYATFQDNGAGQLVEPAFDISAGEYKEGLSAGIVQYTVLEGLVWQDMAGEALPLAGAAIELVNEDGMPIAAMTTGEDGMYRFPQVLPGDYEIHASLPAGYLLVNEEDDRVTSGLMMSIIQEDMGASGQSYPIHVVMGAHENTLDVGAVKPGMLGDKAWLDENGNGLQDTTEAAMPGITIRLVKDGLMCYEAVTDIYGYYLFENVYPSVYDVEIIWHDELIPTRQRDDFKLLCSQLEESDETSQVISGVEVRSDVKNFDFDLGFALREKGEKPEAMKPAPTQVWK